MAFNTEHQLAFSQCPLSPPIDGLTSCSPCLKPYWWGKDISSRSRTLPLSSCVGPFPPLPAGGGAWEARIQSPPKVPILGMRWLLPRVQEETRLEHALFYAYSIKFWMVKLTRPEWNIGSHFPVYFGKDLHQGRTVPTSERECGRQCGEKVTRHEE